MTTKERLHRLVDDLPEQEWHAAERFLQYLRDMATDPVLRLLEEAPEVDEPLTREEEEALRESREGRQRGEWLTDEDVRREPLA